MHGKNIQIIFLITLFYLCRCKKGVNEFFWLIIGGHSNYERGVEFLRNIIFGYIINKKSRYLMLIQLYIMKVVCFLSVISHHQLIFAPADFSDNFTKTIVYKNKHLCIFVPTVLKCSTLDFSEMTTLLCNLLWI